MKRLKVDMENCYGISKLNYDFNFETHSTYAVYSPNGVMKTSFAKTFNDLIQGIESKDLIFPEKTTTRIIIDENNNNIKADNICIIEPYNGSYKSEKVSVLLVNAKLKNEYEKINLQLMKRRIV